MTFFIRNFSLHSTQTSFLLIFAFRRENQKILKIIDGNKLPETLLKGPSLYPVINIDLKTFKKYLEKYINQSIMF